MATKEFKIRLAALGNLTGVWNATPAVGPPILGCTAAQWAAAMTNAGSTNCAGPGTFEAHFFVGPVILFGGNAWDGTYNNINDVPIGGIVPYSVTLRAVYFAPLFAPAAGNTISVDWAAGPLTTNNIPGGAFYTEIIAFPTVQYPNPGFSSFVLLCFEDLKIIFTLTAGETGITRDLSETGLYIIGSYLLITWDWEIANGTDVIGPPDYTVFRAASRIEISAGGGASGDINNIYSTPTPANTGLDLRGDYGPGSGDGINAIIFSWIDGAGASHSVTVPSTDFEDWEIYFFWFTLPDTLPTDILITVEGESDTFPAMPAPAGTGTQFSGRVKLSTIMILGVKGSGVYTVVPDKTNDTFYINSPTNDDTDDFAIPNPFAKTGFIGG